MSIFEHDICRPFPADTLLADRGRSATLDLGTYDIVNARLLVYALSDGDGWAMALSNMAKLLSESDRSFDRYRLLTQLSLCISSMLHD